MQLHAFVFICLMATIMTVHVLGQDLSVTVTPTRTQFNDKQDVEVILNYKNKGSKKVSVCKWYVPSSKLSDPLFEVTRDGERVEYVGPLVKRRAPVAEDMISLEPGKSISTPVQLSDVYNMTVTGNYAVRFNANIGLILSTPGRLLNTEDSSSDVVSDVPLISPLAVLFAIGRSNAIIEKSAKVAPQSRKATYTFYGCSARRQTTIITALQSAATYTSSVVQYLSSVRSPGTTRYVTWFGKYSSSNLLTLKAHFNSTQDVFNTKSMSFDCSCTEPDTYAYVYPTVPYEIYLCPFFWSSTTTGTDSKGGTLIHEVTHFTVVAGTKDHAYGQERCKSLAKSDPTKALNNADSHQYFSENNPALK